MILPNSVEGENSSHNKSIDPGQENTWEYIHILM